MLSINEVAQLIQKTQENFRHQECATCECYLAFITQLEIDGGPEIRELLAGQEPPREEVHACLGCDPCPPGILYGDYLGKRTQARKLPIQKS